MIGKRLGHYVLSEFLGEGGMGRVYRARDERLGRDVAIKVLLPGTLANSKARALFEREASLLSQLNHPNIATVHDFDTQGDVDFLVMELLRGETLKDRLQRGRIPTTEAARLASQLATGLAAAHQAGILHRDIKPGNLHITPDGRLKILDFGLAKVIAAERTKTSDLQTETMSLVGGVAGTLPYMSPEQLVGSSVDRRTDLYAAGATLYEMICGVRAFDQTGPALTQAILGQAPLAPRTIDSQVPPELESITLKCLEKDPARRYQAADDLGIDLERFLSSSSTRRPAISPPRRRLLRLAAVALAILLIALAFDQWRRRHTGSDEAGRLSIAVLPFENIAHDSEQNYFADGMTEDLITALTKIGALRVISRSSVMGYRDAPKTPSQVASELHVGTIILGSVQQSAQRVRVSARLIEAATGRSLWAESYDRDLRDILALQAEVARDIARQVRVQLTPADNVRLAHAPRVNPLAHDAYLRGRYALNEYTDQGSNRACAYFEQALQIDSTYAPAYTGLADAYYTVSSGYTPATEAMPRSRAAAMKALELDDSLAEAYVSLAVVNLVYDWDWAAAETALQRALELNPNLSTAHQQYGYLLLVLGRGRGEAAVEEYQRALELDPLSLVIRSQIGFAQYFARQNDQAIETLRSTVDVDSSFYYPRVFLGLAYAEGGDNTHAVAELQTAMRQVENSQGLAQLGYVLAKAGRSADTRRVLEKLALRARTQFVPTYDLALVHLALGDPERAFALLEQAFQHKSESLNLLKVDPRLDPIRGDPRFQAMLHRVGLAS